MNDLAQIKALSDELAQSPKYSLQCDNLRQEITKQVAKAHPATLDALASVLGIGERYD